MWSGLPIEGLTDATRVMAAHATTTTGAMRSLTLAVNGEAGRHDESLYNTFPESSISDWARCLWSFLTEMDDKIHGPLLGSRGD